jgi:mono/diheme cytochrome c family protein
MTLSSRPLIALLAGLALTLASGCERPTSPNMTEESTSGEATMNASQLPYAPRGAAAKAIADAKAALPPPPTPAADPAERGHQLYVSLACVTCHTTDGSRGLAPSFKGVFGTTVTLADGKQIQVDDAYIKESVLNPTAKLVQGFAPMMPSFAGRVQPQDLDALVAFIKTLK